MTVVEAARAYLNALVVGETTEESEKEIERAVRSLHEQANTDRRGRQ